MATQQGMVEQLQARHVNDGTGHCATCTAGAGAPRPLWPCTLRALADRAAYLRAELARTQHAAATPGATAPATPRPFPSPTATPTSSSMASTLVPSPRQAGS